MAVQSNYGTTYFDSSGNVKSGAPRPPIGSGCAGATETMGTNNTVNDFMAFLPVPTGKRIMAVSLEILAKLDTNGTPTLVADVIYRMTDKLGNNTDTDLVVVNTATGVTTFWSAAANARLLTFVGTLGGPTGVVIPDDADGFGLIGLKIKTAAATAQSATVKLGVWFE